MAKVASRQSRQKTLSLKQTYKSSEPLFGSHWTLDGYGASTPALNSMETVFRALNDLPEILGMKKIITPYVIRFDGNDKKDAGGFSGFVMIAESHIAIHTFPEKQFITIDVYTCQGTIDVKTCRKYFGKLFGIKEFEENNIRRGLRYGSV